MITSACRSMEPMPLEITLRAARSLDGSHADIRGIVTVAVGSTKEFHELAAQRLLGLSIDEIGYQAKEIVTGELSAVVEMMEIDQIIQDRKTFNMMIGELVSIQLEKIGLEVIHIRTDQPEVV